MAAEVAKIPEAKVDYIEIVHPQTLEPVAPGPLRGAAVAALAVRIGATRLIDNLELVAP